MNNFVLSLAVMLLLLTSCAMKVNEDRAQALAAALLEDLKNERYDNLNTYYTSSSMDAEPLDKKIDKFTRLKETTGGIQTYELLSSRVDYDSHTHQNQAELKYKVTGSRLTVEHTFLILNDGGKEKIFFHNIENIR